jgi:hypothetical protein
MKGCHFFLSALGKRDVFGTVASVSQALFKVVISLQFEERLLKFRFCFVSALNLEVAEIRQSAQKSPPPSATLPAEDNVPVQQDLEAPKDMPMGSKMLRW